MSDLIQIVNGNPPWSPTSDTEIVEVVHRYNIPLLAVVEQAGTQFMARCMLGELGPTSMWIYNRLDEIEARILRDGSPDEIDAQADDLCHGQVSVAVAMQDAITFSMLIDVPDDPDMLRRVEVIAEALLEGTSAANRGAEEIAHAQELARVR